MFGNPNYGNFFNQWRTYGRGGVPNPPQDKKKIFLLLMTCNIFVVSLLRFKLKI
jgi:hypothetical protein